MKIVLWNVHGLKNVVDLSEYVTNVDIVSLCETWCAGEPKTHVFPDFSNEKILYSEAVKTAERGRAKGGIAIYLDERSVGYELLETSTSWIIVRLKWNNCKLLYGILYISPTTDLNFTLSEFGDRLSTFICNYPGEPMFLAGDFNARIGNENSFSDEE